MLWPPRRDRAPWAACGLGGARADARFVRQVRAPAGRLRLPRQIGDALGGVEQFLLVDDVVAVEDGAALMAGQAQGDPLGDAGADQGAGGGAPAIVEAAGRHAGRLTGGAPRGAPAAMAFAPGVQLGRGVRPSSAVRS